MTKHESQKASKQVHEGGRYVVKDGKPVKELPAGQKPKVEKKEAK